MDTQNSPTLIEVIAGVAMVGVFALVLLPGLPRMGEMDRRATCADNLRRVGTVFKMYAAEDADSKYPKFGWDVPAPPAGTGDKAMFIFSPWIPSVYPTYLSDPTVFMCPSDPEPVPRNRMDRLRGCLGVIPEVDLEYDGIDPCRGDGCMDLADSSYFYMGWVLDKADEGDLTLNMGRFSAFFGADFSGVDAAAQLVELWDVFLLQTADPAFLAGQFIAASNAADKDYTVPTAPLGGAQGNGDGNVVFRLREGVERFIVTDTTMFTRMQSRIFVMADRITTDTIRGSNHSPAGSNVLYLDGHVEFKKLLDGGTFPINQTTATMMNIFTDVFPEVTCP